MTAGKLIIDYDSPAVSGVGHKVQVYPLGFHAGIHRTVPNNTVVLPSR